MRIKNYSQSGFSLVETLVAITILLLVIIGPMTISSSSTKSTTFASEQITAFFLAQEGVEFIQKARDELVLEYFDNSNPNPWTDLTITNSGPFRFCYQSTGCALSINSDSNGSLTQARSCSSASDCLIYLDTTTSGLRSRYIHTVTDTPTPFTRVIRMQNVSPDEVSVVSTVTWRSGFSRDAQTVSVQTSLFNVYDND